MHMHEAEKLTGATRWNTHSGTQRLEEQWDCRVGEVTWTEWREVPTVNEPPGIKTPTSQHTMD